MYEAQLVASMVAQFGQRFKIAAHRIGVITFYSGQVAAIKVRVFMLFSPSPPSRRCTT